MKIFITGGTGFVGRALVEHLAGLGHQLTVLSRGGVTSEGGPRLVQGDPARPGPWQEEMRRHEAVINLAGHSIFCRWTAANRQRILDSRVLSTRHIVEGIRGAGSGVGLLLNCSAVGFYGNRGDQELTEDSGPGEGFLAEVCRAWEAEAIRAEEAGVRVVRCRLGVVLGRNGGALAQMAPVFRLGLGGCLGNGRQWFPWIHQDDLVGIFNHLLEAPVSGPVNCVAPENATNRDLTRALARAMHRPLLLPSIPAFVLRLLQGRAADLLLDSQKVRPQFLTRIGFAYRHPSLAGALDDLLRPAD